MDSRISVRPAAFPDPRCPETAGAPNLAFAFLALSAICSGLGLVVLGLEQGGTSRYLVWNCSGPDSVWIDGDFSAGDRSVVQQIRAVEQGASGPGCLH